MTTVQVGRAAVVVDLRFQSLSLIECLPELDGDGDGRLSPAELEAASETIGAYVQDHYRLARVVDADEGAPAAAVPSPTPLAGSPVSVQRLSDAEAGPLELQWLGVRLRFPLAEPLAGLQVESELFVEANPLHQDVTRVEWQGRDLGTRMLSAGDGRAVFRPSLTTDGSLAAFVRLGIEHILGGWDHLAFLLALLVACRRLRVLVGVVTAFTLAHSVTLACAALGLFELPPRLVELAIALSIAYVATTTLVRDDVRNPWPEAFGFGLLHGLGFAGFLADALVGQRSVVAPLFGFNLGVEIGQLAFVTLLALPFALTRGRRSTTDDTLPPLTPRWFRRGASGLVAALGFAWFLQRAGWVPGPG